MPIDPRRLGQLALACGAAAGCALGCAEPAEIPELPSLAELSQEYDAPTAEIDQQDARAYLDSMPELEPLLAAFRSTATMVQRVEDAKEPAQERTGEGIQLRGALYVTLRCPGQLAQPEYDEVENGSVSLTLAVAASHVRRTIGGKAQQCRFNGKLGDLPIAVVLDGGMDLDMGADMPLGQAWAVDRWLVAIQGSVQVNDVSFSGVSARISNDAVEYLLRLPDGTSVVLSAAPPTISVRTQDTTWSCNTAGGPCVHD
jgi:hypothetical protein